MRYPVFLPLSDGQQFDDVVAGADGRHTLQSSVAFAEEVPLSSAGLSLQLGADWTTVADAAGHAAFAAQSADIARTAVQFVAGRTLQFERLRDRLHVGRPDAQTGARSDR